MLPDDAAQLTVDALRASLNKLGLNEETKDSPGLWKIGAEFMLILGVNKPWPSIDMVLQSACVEKDGEGHPEKSLILDG